MKLIKSICALIPVLTIVSCRTNDSLVSEVKLLMIDTLDISVFVESVDYITLEYRDDCILNNISQILFFDSTYVLVDGSKENNSIYFFDINGRFKRKIRRFGRGPGEYLSITTVDICKRDSTIYLYDYNSSMVQKYDLTGYHLNTYNADGIIASDFKKLDNTEFAFYSPDEPAYIGDLMIPRGLFIYDYNSRIFSSLIEYPETNELLRVFNSTWFTEYGDTIGLVSAYNGNFFRYVEGTFKLRTVFSFPIKELGLPKSEYNLIYKANPVESEKYLFFYSFFKEGKSFHPVLFNKSESYGIIASGIRNLYKRQLPVFLGSEPKAFFGLIYPDKLQDSERDDLVTQFGIEIQIGGNPLLAIYNLKN